MRLPEITNPCQHCIPTHVHPSHTTRSFWRKHRGASSVAVGRRVLRICLKNSEWTSAGGARHTRFRDPIVAGVGVGGGDGVSDDADDVFEDPDALLQDE